MARKTQRKKRKGPQITRMTQELPTTPLDEQATTLQGRAPAHSRHLRPFAFFALSLSFYRLTAAMAEKLGYVILATLAVNVRHTTIPPRHDRA
jgi:hypothetical protein